MAVTDAPTNESRLLGAGGEAEVFRVHGRPDLAEKRWRNPSLAQARKLTVMLAHPPQGATFEGHVNLAWPTDVVRDVAGAVVGFRMPAVDLNSSLPLFTAYNPDARRSDLAGISWRHLVRTGRNLASVVGALHAAGYVVGDLNESNVLVDRRALVTILDCDSIQVADPGTGELHHCGVARPEFLAPELAGRDLSTTARRLPSDRFALAVMVFLLLREGVHPYAGIWRGRGEPPDLSARMRGRRFPHVPLTRSSPPPASLGLRGLGFKVRLLFLRAFVLGPFLAAARPSAPAWERALTGLEDALVECDRSPTHVHRRRSRCPWCARVDRGLPDPFPSLSGATVPRRPPSRLAVARTTVARSVTRQCRRAARWVWRHTARARHAAPPVFGLAALTLLAPALVGVALLVTLSVVRHRKRTLSGAARAVRAFLPRLVERVRPAYWYVLATVAVGADRWATAAWSWPLTF